MEKVLATVKDCYGEETPTAVLIQEDGLLHLWEVACLSSKQFNFGNCLCVNHEAVTDNPISTSEVIERFGIEALNGFGEPSREQLVFDAFGIESNELETFLRVSYTLGSNPLLALRSKFSAPVTFSETTDGITITGAEPGDTVFIINSRGEISVKEI